MLIKLHTLWCSCIYYECEMDKGEYDPQKRTHVSHVYKVEGEREWVSEREREKEEKKDAMKDPSSLFYIDQKVNFSNINRINLISPPPNFVSSEKIDKFRLYKYWQIWFSQSTLKMPMACKNSNIKHIHRHSRSASST